LTNTGHHPPIDFAEDPNYSMKLFLHLLKYSPKEKIIWIQNFLVLSMR